MIFSWKNYEPESMSFVEEWLDEEAVRFTGMDDGWKEFYDYWIKDEYTILGENFWSKVIYEKGIPIAAVAVGYYENKFNIMETVVDTKLRSRGKGAQLIRELIDNGEAIIGKEIDFAEAVIYPSNPASQKAFEKAGFRFSHAHDDGDVLYYIYEKELCV